MRLMTTAMDAGRGLPRRKSRRAALQTPFHTPRMITASLPPAEVDS
ncbi:hypothetical protein GALL_357620 [mine drainage metagenome]|uniref:Uncharacterized protein n=1 Tax=mine drainage metagenome TaxID=410659 RepID=A0A1J5QG61_9ZZZZ